MPTFVYYEPQPIDTKQGKRVFAKGRIEITHISEEEWPYYHLMVKEFQKLKEKALHTHKEDIDSLIEEIRATIHWINKSCDIIELEGK